LPPVRISANEVAEVESGKKVIDEVKVRQVKEPVVV
jgi:hypothetical protein